MAARAIGCLMRLFDVLANRRIRRMLDRAPRRSLAELPENTFGRVTGLVEPLDAHLLEAPLSGRPCVYYSVVILGVGARLARRLAAEHDSVPFVLEAGGRRAVVDPAHAQISSPYDHLRESGLAVYNERQREILVRHHLLDRYWVLTTTTFSYREAILGVGEAVAVYGAGTRERDPDPSLNEWAYRDGGPTRLRFTGTKRFPLVISDDPRSL